LRELPSKDNVCEGEVKFKTVYLQMLYIQVQRINRLMKQQFVNNTTCNASTPLLIHRLLYTYVVFSWANFIKLPNFTRNYAVYWS